MKPTQRERGILMCGEMVRAILDGRKIQTRRVAKLDPRMMEDEAVDWCPHGKPGDLLWVKETFACVDYMQTIKTVYRATSQSFKVRWTPAIFMPKCESRITLEIVSARVERLQEITEDDAKAEGVEPRICGSDNGYPVKGYRTGFVYIWQEFNAKHHPWASNPHVWVIGFKRV